MRTHEIHSTTCALTRLLPPDSNIRQVALPPRQVRQGDDALKNHAYTLGPRITHIDRAIIRAYFSRQIYERMRELDDAGVLLRLPQQWTCNGRLPRHIQTVLLPQELELKLSALDGYKRVRVGSDLLLIETATRTIVDVLRRIYSSI